MKKHIIITFAAFALLTSACGKDASFKNVAKLSGDSVTPPAPPADLSTEAKAEAILADDVNVNQSKATNLSLALLQEIRGVTLTISTGTGEKDDGRPVAITTAKITVASAKNNECPTEEKTVKSFKIAEATQNFITINDGGRFRCLEENCENILLIMEASRNVKVDTENGQTRSEFQFGSLAVLLKKSEEGAYKPVSTESVNFAQLQDAKTAELNCIDEISVEEAIVVTTPSSGETLSISDRVRAYQAAQIAKDKATQEAIAKGQIPAQTIDAAKPKISISDRVRAYRAALIAKEKAAKVSSSIGATTHSIITPTPE